MKKQEYSALSSFSDLFIEETHHDRNQSSTWYIYTNSCPQSLLRVGATSHHCVARLALALLQSALRFQTDPTPFPFERLPPELRLQVYHEALSGAAHDGVVCTKTIMITCNRNYDFRFRFGNQGKGASKEINVSLLATNKFVNNEAIPVLFQSRTFDFMTNVKGVVPFLSSLSHEGRQICIGLPWSSTASASLGTVATALIRFGGEDQTTRELGKRPAYRNLQPPTPN